MTRQCLPTRREHEVFEFEHFGVRFVAGLGRFSDGRLAEVFLNTSKVGSAVEVQSRDAAILLSFALQHGADPTSIRRALSRNGDGEPGGPIARLLDIFAGEGA
jgi:ribonucleoside-diphosphate reductase alpha chain